MPLPEKLTGIGTRRGTAADNRMLNAYPNPVGVGQTLYLKTDTDDRLLQNAVIEVYDILGRHIGHYPIQGHITAVNVKYTTGIYVFVLKCNDKYRKEVKIMVK